MKKLIVSVKPAAQAFREAKNRLAVAEKKRGKVQPHYEIAFSDLKQFKKFIGNIDVLTSIQIFKPNSIYELASAMEKDVANINRLINFFAEIGAIRIEQRVIGEDNLKVAGI